LTKRSDFRSAEGLVQCSPYGGVESGKQRTTGLAKAAEAYGRITRNEARFRIVLVTPVQRTFQPLKLDQSSTRGCGDGFRAAQHIQLGENVVQVPFYSELADEELRAYFLIGLAVGE